jgi:ATP-dependent RNA helicase DDX46/PRP5
MAKMRAQLCAAALNAKAKAKAPVASDKMVEAELEINDYPQQARWKVTHKDALTPITEWTNCAITTRGTFVAPGRAPMPGERKLYLFIEGNDELSVHRAKTEIKRILNEAASSFQEKDGKFK